MKTTDIIQTSRSRGSERFTAWLAFILKWECVFNEDGDIVTENVSGDNGGLTFAGIDKASHPKFNYRNPNPGDIVDIYFKDYWSKVRAQEMAWPVGEVTANFAVNMGYSRAARMLQSAINLTPKGGTTRVDASIGDKTIKAANLENPEQLADLIEDVADETYRGFVVATPRLKKFLQGWLNRDNALESWWMKLRK